MQFWQLTRKIHISWFVAIGSAAFVVGVSAAQSPLAALFASLGWVIMGIGMTLFTVWRPMVVLIPAVFVAWMFIGIWYGIGTYSQLSPYKKILGSVMTVTGTVNDDPDLGKRNDTLLRLSNIKIEGAPVAGSVWVSVAKKTDIQRSDIVTVRGKLSSGFGSFGAAIYRATILKIERAEPGDVALRVRDWFANSVRMSIDEPQVSLGLGYLLGLRRALPPELDEALMIAGLTHVVVASGYNLTILVRLARRLFVKASKYLATLSAGTMIIAFVAITGMSPSMSRAGLVAGLSLAAWYYGRKFHPLILLPFAAAITVAINPAYAWNDLGWQLSFAAFAGVMILAPLLQQYFYGDKKPGVLRQIMGETLSATIVTLPIIVLAFGQFSNIALIANMLILPLVPLAMLLTFVAGVGTLFMPAVAPFIGIPAQWLLTYMTATAQFLADLPWALTTMEVQAWMAWAAYGLLIVLCVYLWRLTGYDLRQSNIVE